jgi:hypothetical protein
MENERISRTVLDTEIVKTLLLKGVTGEGDIDRTSPFFVERKVLVLTFLPFSF